MRWIIFIILWLPLAGFAQLIFQNGFESEGFTVGGEVIGLTGTGLTLQLEGHENLSILSNGPFTFVNELPDGENYEVLVGQHPGNPDQACTVMNSMGVINGASVADVTVTCTIRPTPPLTSPGGDFRSSIEFLYSGPDAPQVGVNPEDIELDRASVLYGRIFDGDGSPLPGVSLTILDHPEYGQTSSEPDGRYRLAVNGGKELVVDASAPGLLPSQRRVNVPWNVYVAVEDMALVMLDPAVTTVTAGSVEAQLAVGSTTVDERGARSGRLLFPADTTFEIVMPSGTTTPLSSMEFRITEYTVGELGPIRMPGDLPERSAYTYAMELSADEAISAGAASVQLNQPAWYYVDNFLEFPSGEVVPNGYYSRQRGLWLSSDNGRIVEVISINAGISLLDVDGDGQADAGAKLDELGITTEELEIIATEFIVGDSFWRIPVTHFTPYDCNWPFELPEDSEPPPEEEPEPEEPDPCSRPGSVIECPTRVLGEELTLAGSNVRLHYRSNRVPGFTRALTADITVTEEVLPLAVPARSELIVEIAGQQHVYEYEPVTTGITETFTWDRRDQFGRMMQGRQTLVTSTRHYYEYIYTGASTSVAQAFGVAGNATSLGPSGAFDYLETRSNQTLGLWDARGVGLGGWTLGIHHTLDPDAGVVYEGTGNIRQLPGNTIDTLLDQTPSIYHLSVAPDGSILANGNSSNVFIKRIQPDGTDVTIAGGGSVSCEVTSIQFPDVSQFEGIRPTMAVEAPDGTVIFTETLCNRISRLELDGSWSPVAGTADSSGYAGDSGPALTALLWSPRGLALGSDGSIYFSDSSNQAVRRIGPDGVIETFAGGNGFGYDGDGGLAIDARLAFPGYLAVGPDGSLYVVDQGTQFGSAVSTTRGTRIRRIGPDGMITTVAGDGTSGGSSSRPVEGGVPATSTGIDAEAIVVSPQGEIFFNELINHIIRRISPDGTITTYAGIPGAAGNDGDGGPAVGARFFTPAGLALTPDGRLLVNDRGNSKIREVRPSGTSGDGEGNYLVPSVDASEVFVFSGAGLHLRTVDALTGITRFQFEYDSNFRLGRIDEAYGVYMDIDRPDESTIVISAQTGETNTLTLDGNGFLASLAFPGGETRSLTHDAGGLLTQFGDFRAFDSEFEYDVLGRLELDRNRAGYAALLNDNAGAGLDVTLSDANGAMTRFASVPDDDGSRAFERVAPYGGITASMETADGQFFVTFEDGLEIDSTLAPDPRWGGSAPFEASRVVRTPGGLTLNASNDIQATFNGGDPSDLATLTVTTIYDGEQSQSVWNSALRNFTSTSAEGLVTTQTYDIDGRLVNLLEDPAFDPSVIAYDVAGRLSQVTRGSGVFTQTYDGVGRLASIGNNEGLNLTFDHDANGRPLTVTWTGGDSVAFGYTDEGQIETVTLPSSAVHNFGYHPNGQLASYVAPGGSPLQYVTRNDGSLAGVTLPGGRTATRTFDASQRPTGWVSSESTILASYVPATTHVDMTTWTPAIGSPQVLDLDYDGPLVTRMSWSGVSNAQVDLSYDSAFQLETSVLNSGTQRLLTRDGDGRLIGDGPFTWQRANPRRAMSSINDGTATVQQTVNGLGLLASRTLTVNGILVHELALTYRNDRRVDSVTETLGAVADDRSYVYDSDNRLTDVMDGALTLESFAYDANLNRTNLDMGTSIVQTYDTQDRLTSIGGATVTVNDDGQTSVIGNETFSHGTRGELLSLTVAGATVSFTYDGYGRRVARTEDADTTSYVYGDPDRQNRITAVREADGTWLEYYYDETGLLYAVDRAGTWFYISTDHIGSPRVVANATGTVVKVIDYSAFGEVLSDSNSSLELHIGFAGGLREPDTGLLRFGIRDYHPRIGRFLTRDPLLFRGGSVNLYAYVLNDPVNLVDRTGLFPGFTIPAGGFGASAHAGFGYKYQLSSDGAGGYGFCWGVGVGGGISYGIDPDARPSTSVGVEGEVGIKVPYLPVEVGGDTAVRWVRCPPGSARRGYWEFSTFKPKITVGPVTLGLDGITVGHGPDINDLGDLAGHMTSNADFTGCAAF